MSESVDVNEFVTTHKLNFLDAHTFLRVSRTFKHFIFITRRARKFQATFSGNKAVRPTGNTLLSFLPAILACEGGCGTCAGVRGRAFVRVCVQT